jgi:hypothetical protein
VDSHCRFDDSNQLPGVCFFRPGAGFACSSGPNGRQRSLITQHPLDLWHLNTDWGNENDSPFRKGDRPHLACYNCAQHKATACDALQARSRCAADRPPRWRAALAVASCPLESTLPQPHCIAEHGIRHRGHNQHQLCTAVLWLLFPRHEFKLLSMRRNAQCKWSEEIST